MPSTVATFVAPGHAHEGAAALKPAITGTHVHVAPDAHMLVVPAPSEDVRSRSSQLSPATQVEPPEMPLTVTRSPKDELSVAPSHGPLMLICRPRIMLIR